jgi:hypothetical protein
LAARAPVETENNFELQLRRRFDLGMAQLQETVVLVLIVANKVTHARWAVIIRIATRNPRKAAQHAGETVAGLDRLVNDGRQMLINRKV